MNTDITANRHGGNEFSDAASRTVDKAYQRTQILKVITDSGTHGFTADEVEVITGWSHQSVSARFTELKTMGALVPGGRRKTRSGRTAGVWVAAPVQQQELWSA